MKHGKAIAAARCCTAVLLAGLPGRAGDWMLLGLDSERSLSYNKIVIHMLRMGFERPCAFLDQAGCLCGGQRGCFLRGTLPIFGSSAP